MAELSELRTDQAATRTVASLRGYERPWLRCDVIAGLTVPIALWR
jgi:hypothetical protein